MARGRPFDLDPGTGRPRGVPDALNDRPFPTRKVWQIEFRERHARRRVTYEVPRLAEALSMLAQEYPEAAEIEAAQLEVRIDDRGG